MTYHDGNTILDLMLADIIRRIQLTDTDRARGNSAYRSIADHLDSEGSLLAGTVARVYGQGSLPQGSTILHGDETEDRFDIDAIVEIVLQEWADPKYVQEQLYKSLNRGRYAGKVTRKSRCVTIQQLNLHIDLTPVVRLPLNMERPSRGFHFNHEDPAIKYHFETNPKGMLDYFRRAMPKYYVNIPAFDHAPNVRQFMEAAETEPLPDAIPLGVQPIRLMALQLLKRYRNRRYSKRDGRQVPSVYLSYMAATVQQSASSLLRDLITLAQAIRQDLFNAWRLDLVVDHKNPTWNAERINDRWPATLRDEEIFITDLDHLVSELTSAAGKSLEQQQRILSRLFGEKPTEYALNQLIERTDDSLLRNVAKTLVGKGGVTVASIAPVGALVSAPAQASLSSPRNTNFGGYLDDDC
ncbi:MAG: nucleotidyltransferase [Alphaproteobacteria bacterium]|nr:nucleotidyltransferase [Alphaproteobacteria bacterium]